MSYLRLVNFTDVLDHAEIPGWRSAAPSLKNWPVKASWNIVTPVRDNLSEIENSYFFRSIKNECDDSKKRSSLLNIASLLITSINLENYRDGFSNSNVEIKEAHSFKYKNKNEKLLEFKYQNKNRLYFYDYKINNKKLIILIRFHHKKDQKTPDEVKSHGENTIKSVIDSCEIT